MLYGPTLAYSTIWTPQVSPTYLQQFLIIKKTSMKNFRCSSLCPILPLVSSPLWDDFSLCKLASLGISLLTWLALGLEDSPEEIWAIIHKWQTIREIEVSKKNTLKFVPHMERSLKALKESFLPLTKVFLEVEIISNEKRSKPSTLNLRENHHKM